MYLNVLLLLVFAACFAGLYNSGLWSNTLSLINVVTAALLATNYFEPLAGWLDKQVPSFTYVWDFAAIWLIFAASMMALRAATDYVSRVKVRFFPPVDQVGSILFACWIAWVMVCFTTMTLHTAPLARNFLDGAFQPEPDSRMFFGRGPDRLWLSWVHKESKGSLCRLREIVPFDAQGDFILRYASRREQFEKQLSLTKSDSKAPSTAMPK
ncbi:MAG: CvpA family protein [Planctomycetia bacterium]|nr:CvpA family protein [Planctomycetia bacterium]